MLNYYYLIGNDITLQTGDTRQNVKSFPRSISRACRRLAVVALLL